MRYGKKREKSKPTSARKKMTTKRTSAKKKDANWMQKAVGKEGALRKMADQEGGMTKSGKISRSWMDKKLSDPRTSTTVKRRINLAKTFAKYRKK
jgi:hypothetical protein